MSKVKTVRLLKIISVRICQETEDKETIKAIENMEGCLPI